MTSLYIFCWLRNSASNFIFDYEGVWRSFESCILIEEPSQNLQLKIKCWSVSKVIRNSSDMNDPDKSFVWMILILTVFRRKYHFIIHYKGSIFRSQYQELDYAFISSSCTRINCPILVITPVLKQHSASIVLSLSFCLAHW